MSRRQTFPRWWPRGRFNGRPITGARVSFSLDVGWWWWKPVIARNFGEPYALWLCFAVRIACEYGSDYDD